MKREDIAKALTETIKILQVLLEEARKPDTRTPKFKLPSTKRVPGRMKNPTGVKNGCQDRTGWFALVKRRQGSKGISSRELWTLALAKEPELGIGPVAGFLNHNTRRGNLTCDRTVTPLRYKVK